MVTMVLLNVAWICTMPEWTTRFSFFLNVFFLAGLAGAFAIELCLRRRFLLVGHSAAARSFARAGVGVRPLAAYRQAAAMPHASVGAHLDVALDIHGDFLAQDALHRTFLFENLAHAVHFVLGEIADFLIKVDPGPVEQGTRTAAAHAVDVGEADFGPLLGWQIHACNTCHDFLLSLTLLMLRIRADDPHHTVAMDHLAFIANFLDRCSYFHS